VRAACRTGPDRIETPQLPRIAGVDLFGTTITDGQTYMRAVLWPRCMAEATAAWHLCRELIAMLHGQLPTVVFAVRTTHSRLRSMLAHVSQIVSCRVVTVSFGNANWGHTSTRYVCRRKHVLFVPCNTCCFPIKNCHHRFWVLLQS